MKRLRLTDEAVRVWGEASANAKHLEGQDAEAHKVCVSASLAQLYRAVAFDVDGTLTEADGLGLDAAIAKQIVDLLRRGVPVFLITGRGRQGTRSAFNNLCELTGLRPDEMRRLRLVTHNGLFMLTPQGARLSEEKLVAALPNLESLLASVKSVLVEAGVAALPSLEPRDLPSSIRIEFEASPPPPHVMESLAKLAANHEPQLFLTQGKYGGLPTVDLSPTDKARAVAALAHRFDLREERILRVGDQGQAGGNDHSLLASSAGFSVGALSNDPTCCLAVVADDGAVLGAAQAVARLLSVSRLCADISRPSDGTRNELLRRALVEFEGEAVARAARETRMLERQLTVRVSQLISHDPGQGDLDVRMTDIFDPMSGGVRLRDWELLQLLDEAPISDLFGFADLERASLDQSGPERCMYTDSGVLLRGPSYYMNVAKRQGQPQLAAWGADAGRFVAGAGDCLKYLANTTPSFAHVKVALALMDNVRDVILQTLNVALMVCEPPGEPDAEDFATAAAVGSLAIGHTRAHLELLLDSHKPWKKSLADYQNSLDQVAEWFVSDSGFGALVSRIGDRADQDGDWAAGAEQPFKWREADDLLQNVSAIAIGLRHVASREEGALLAVGLPYGGLELPIIAHVLGERMDLDISPAALRFSVYGHKERGAAVRAGSEEYLKSLDENAIPLIPLSEVVGSGPIDASQTTVLLLDDNCTTATTLQNARDLLVINGADVGGAIVVRFPSIARAAHMELDEHGFLDLDLAHNFVWGLVGASPYSRLILEHPDGGDARYLDENGVFDKAKMRISRLLHKNQPHSVEPPSLHTWGSP